MFILVFTRYKLNHVNSLKDVDSKMFTRMLCSKKFEPVTLTFDLENQQGSRLFERLSMYQFWSKSIEGCRFQSIHKEVKEGRTDGRKEGRKEGRTQRYYIPSQLRWRGDNKNVDTTFSSHDAFMEKLVKYMVFFPYQIQCHLETPISKFWSICLAIVLSHASDYSFCIFKRFFFFSLYPSMQSQNF